LREPFNPLAEMLASAAVLRPSSGRFWDTDSDSECEDLGDAEVLRPAVSSSPAPLQRPPAGAASSNTGLPSARSLATPPRRSSATPPRRAKPPWKSLWKGPLPPARLSSPATLEDFLSPGFTDRRGAAGARADPRSTPVQSGKRIQYVPEPVKAHQAFHRLDCRIFFIF
jgi:hypothetical protein